jgi:hypothetical protein
MPKPKARVEVPAQAFAELFGQNISSPDKQVANASGSGDESDLPRRGMPKPFNLKPLPEIPASIEQISNIALKDHAIETWRAATRLEVLLRFWGCFLRACHEGATICDQDQEILTKDFDELKGCQELLGQLAALPKSAASEALNANSEPPLDYEFSVFVQAFFVQVQLNIKTLAMKELKASDFSTTEADIDEAAKPILDGAIDLTKSPPTAPLNRQFDPILADLQEEVRILIKSLKAMPVQILGLAKDWPGLPKEPPSSAEQIVGSAWKKKGRRDGKGGRDKLEIANPPLAKLYQYIYGKHKPGRPHKETLDRIQHDTYFSTNLKDAIAINSRVPSGEALIANALEWIRSRNTANKLRGKT